MTFRNRNKTTAVPSRRLLRSTLCLASVLTFAAMADEPPTPWRDAVSDDGRIQIAYRLSDQPIADGNDKEPVLESRASYVGDFDMAASLARLEDLDVLKIVEDVDVAVVLNQQSAHRHLLYVSVEGTWPIPDADAVLRMIRTANKEGTQASIQLFAEPSAAADRGMRRFTRYEVAYELEQQPDGQVKITIASRKTPPFNVPGWLLKTALPTAGFEQMERLIAELEAGR